MPRHSPCALSSLTCSSQSPLRFVSALAKTPPAPLLLAFRRKLVFGEWGTGVTVLLRVVREFLVLFENYAGLQRSKLYVTLHPFGCCSTINFLAMCFHMAPLCCLTLHFFALFSFQGAGRRKKLHFARFASQQSSHRSVLSPLPISNASLV